MSRAPNAIRAHAVALWAARIDAARAAELERQLHDRIGRPGALGGALWAEIGAIGWEMAQTAKRPPMASAWAIGNGDNVPT